MSTELFYIASLKHTHRHHEHIVFWGKDYCGYTPVVGDYIGAYNLLEADELNDGLDCLAVPVEAVEALLSAEPMLSVEIRFYDQRGHVVDNTRANWTRLAEASRKAFPVTTANRAPIKPETFRGKRQSISPVEA